MFSTINYNGALMFIRYSRDYMKKSNFKLLNVMKLTFIFSQHLLSNTFDDKF